MESESDPVLRTKEKFGSSTTKYLASQGTYRSSQAIVLNTTPAQEAKMAHFFQKNYGSKNLAKYSKLSHDCATAVGGALSSAGIGNAYIGTLSMAGVILPPQLPSTPAAMAMSFPGSSVVNLPKGGSIPKLFKSFDPTNEK